MVQCVLPFKCNMIFHLHSNVMHCDWLIYADISNIFLDYCESCMKRAHKVGNNKFVDQ